MESHAPSDEMEQPRRMQTLNGKKPASAIGQYSKEDTTGMVPSLSLPRQQGAEASTAMTKGIQKSVAPSSAGSAEPTSNARSTNTFQQHSHSIQGQQIEATQLVATAPTNLNKTVRARVKGSTQKRLRKPNISDTTNVVKEQRLPTTPAIRGPQQGACVSNLPTKLIPPPLEQGSSSLFTPPTKIAAAASVAAASGNKSLRRSKAPSIATSNDTTPQETYVSSMGSITGKAPKGNKRKPIKNATTMKRRRKSVCVSSTLKSKRTRRKSSTNATTCSTEKFHIVDEAPDRLANPLVGTQAPACGADLFIPTELVYARPDTFPVSFMARLLGFKVPPPNPKDTATLPFPTPLPDIKTLPFCNDHYDPFLQIPPEGPRIRWHEHHQVTRYGDSDDRQTLDYMDPVYYSLLTRGFLPEMLKPAPSALASRFAAQQQEKRRESIVDMAKQHLGDELIGWTFRDWTASTSDKTSKPQWTIDGRRLFSNPTSFGIVACYDGKPCSLLRYQFLWYQLQIENSDKRESELVMVIDGISPWNSAEHDRKPAKDSLHNNTLQHDTKVTSPSFQAKLDCAVDNTSREEGTDMDFDGTCESKGETCRGLENDRLENQQTEQTESIERPGFDREAVAAAPTTALRFDAVTKEVHSTSSHDKDKNEKDDHARVGNLGRSDSLSAKIASSNDKRINENTDALSVHGKRDSNQQTATNSQDLSSKEIPEPVLMVVTALALEHTRACDVWYCLVETLPSMTPSYETYFRMARLPNRNGQSGVSLICDLKKCSSRYAFLRMKEGNMVEDTEEKQHTKERILVRLPTVDEAKAHLESRPLDNTQRPKRNSTKATGRAFTGATGRMRDITVRLRAKLPSSADALPEIVQMNDDGTEGPRQTVPQNVETVPQFDILKCFALPNVKQESNEEHQAPKNWILAELEKKQSELLSLENRLKPRLRSLLAKVVDERIDYHRPENVEKRADEKRLLCENEKIVARRKEMDLAWQKQLEQDMDAVCNICNDGEVTPDNQIIFCEACNVAVHQLCYGVTEVPEGDYYCTACRHFRRGEITQAVARKSRRDVAAPPRITPPPLPICCELCPLKQGAFIRTETPKYKPFQRNNNLAQWVHMVCAKWQGLQFIHKNNPEVVEEVASLKLYFQRQNIKCDICQGQRGAYNQCRFEGCQKWLHITCARASGLCEVIHGEDVNGNVSENPWTLLCPEHSTIDQEELTRDPVPVDQLIRAAKEFPVERLPEPPPVPPKPFNRFNGKERAKWLANHDYEQEFLAELITKKLAGVRCEVCDVADDDFKQLSRCCGCGVVVCVCCRLPSDTERGQKAMKCASCKYVENQVRKGIEFDQPQCNQCLEKGGLLLKSFANPVNRQSYWKANKKEFAKTMFSTQMWCHTVCAFWNRDLLIDNNNAEVDCSNVVMSNGRGFVLSKNRCALCGLNGGMKVKCSDESCKPRGDRRVRSFFHATCARQAGLELNHRDDLMQQFYVKCYKHGGNEFNLRARLEDLLEIEKNRSGKRLGQIDSPMTFNHASRLLNQSILVVKTLGWAWRWAEFWVEHGSSWEPLLEPGENESDMTREQLKIVDSTPESRCADARRCRLAAFGAALRDRKYDTDEGFDNQSLDRALRAILSTPSLVGPLENFEINFFAEWLGRAYRSKSRLLGLGPEKHEVASDSFCVHRDDNTPKYDLGKRPLPGSHILPSGQVFEPTVEEPDDFLKPDITEENQPLSTTQKFVKKESALMTRSVASDTLEKTVFEAQPVPKLDSSIVGPDESTPSSLILLASSDNVAGVAALAPSAVKLRRGRRTRNSSATEYRLAAEAPDKRERNKIGQEPLRQVSVGNELIGTRERDIGSTFKLQHEQKSGPTLEAMLTNQGISGWGDSLPKSKRQSRSGFPKVASVFVILEGCRFIPSADEGEAPRNHQSDRNNHGRDCGDASGEQDPTVAVSDANSKKRKFRGRDIEKLSLSKHTEISATDTKSDAGKVDDTAGTSRQNSRIPRIPKKGIKAHDSNKYVALGSAAVSKPGSTGQRKANVNEIVGTGDAADGVFWRSSCNDDSGGHAFDNRVSIHQGSFPSASDKRKRGQQSLKRRDHDKDCGSGKFVNNATPKAVNLIRPRKVVATPGAGSLDTESTLDSGNKVLPSQTEKQDKASEKCDNELKNDDTPGSLKICSRRTDVDLDLAADEERNVEQANGSKDKGQMLNTDKKARSAAVQVSKQHRQEGATKTAATQHKESSHMRMPARRSVMGMTNPHRGDEPPAYRNRKWPSSAKLDREFEEEEELDENSEDDHDDDNDGDEDFEPEGIDGSDESKVSTPSSDTKSVSSKNKSRKMNNSRSKKREASDEDCSEGENSALEAASGRGTASRRCSSKWFHESPGDADSAQQSSRRSKRKRVKRIMLDQSEDGSDPEDSLPLSLLIESTRSAYLHANRNSNDSISSRHGMGSSDGIDEAGFHD